MATVLDQSYAGSIDASEQLRINADREFLVIQFVPSVSADRNQIELQIKQEGTIVAGDIWAEIWTDSGDEPNVQIGADSDKIDATTVAGDYAFVTFTLSAPITLVKGTKYWIVLVGDYEIGANGIKYAVDNTSPTYSYKGCGYKGDSWTIFAGTTRCFNFKEYYDDATLTYTSPLPAFRRST